MASPIRRIGCRPGKVTLHDGQSRSWCFEPGKENKNIKSDGVDLYGRVPPHPKENIGLNIIMFPSRLQGVTPAEGKARGTMYYLKYILIYYIIYYLVLAALKQTQPRLVMLSVLVRDI